MAGTYNVDPESGTVTFSGSSELTKADHSNMPARTSVYLDTDERGHNQAASLGGNNSPLNVFAQAKDLNHGSYYEMEQGHRNALKSGAQISSEKIAFTTEGVGSRPSAFMDNDTITYADGKVQSVHNSFSNIMNAEHESFNALADKYTDLMDEFDNPGDALRDSMSETDYSELMSATDAEMPNVADMYQEADFSGLAGEGEALSGENSAESTEMSSDPGISADTGPDNGVENGMDA